MSLFPMNPTQQIDRPVKKDTAVSSICAYDERKANVAAILLFTKLDGRQSSIYREKLVRESLATFGINERRAVDNIVAWADEHRENGCEFKRLYSRELKGAIYSRNMGTQQTDAVFNGVV